MENSSLQTSITIRFQLQDMVLLFGTILLLDPVHFQKYEVCLLIGSILNFEAFLGPSFMETT